MQRRQLEAVRSTMDVMNQPEAGQKSNTSPPSAKLGAGIRSLVPKGSRVGPLSDSVALPPAPTTSTLTLKLFQGERAISTFDDTFNPPHRSSHSFSTLMSSDLHGAQLVGDLDLPAVVGIGMADRVRAGLRDRELQVGERLLGERAQARQAGEGEPAQRDVLRAGRNGQPDDGI
jgi:hypothetical protein